MIEEVAEVHVVRFSHGRESGHPDKCGRIFCLHEEDPFVKIGQDWTTLAIGFSKGNNHKESIDNEIYELVNFELEIGLVQGCGFPAMKTSGN